MRLRWLLIGCLIGPASANSDLWIHRSDLSSQLLAQAYLEPLSEAVGEELTLALVSRQDVPFTQPQGRVGITDARWAQQLKTLHSDA